MLKGLKSLLKRVFSKSKKEEEVVSEIKSMFSNDNEWYGDSDPTTLRVFDGVSYDEDGNEYDISESEQYYEECRRKFYATTAAKEEEIDENNVEKASGRTGKEGPRKTQHLKLYFDSLDEDVEINKDEDIFATKENLRLEKDYFEPELYQFLIRNMLRNDYFNRLQDADYANVKLEMMERQEAEMLEEIGIMRTKRKGV